MENKASEAPPAPPRKSAWEVWSVRIGVATAAVGLLTALLGLPDRISTALRGDEPASPADVAARTALEEAKPRLDVRYVFLAQDLMREGGRPAASDDSVRANAARSFLSLPVVQTEAGGGAEESSLGVPDTAFEYAPQHTAFLVVRNVGGRAAGGVTLRADRLPLSAAVPIREAGVGGDDYAALLRRSARGAARIDVQVPQTLEPGDGVLIPLFRGTAPGPGGRWWVYSPIALLPDSLTFTDAVLGEPSSVPVRRMANPMVIADGVVGRG